MGLIASFVATTLVLAMLPGVGQAVMFRQTLVHGRSAAWACIAGTAAGLIVWSVAAAAGLSAVLLANATAYAVLRTAGGCFLAYLGLQSLLSLRHRGGPVSTGRPGMAGGPVAGPGSESGAGPGSRSESGGECRRGFVAGLATNLGNPKAGVFAVSLLPQFVPEGVAGGSLFWTTTALGVLWAGVTTAWYALFVWAVGRGRDIVTRPAFHGWLNGTSGILLLVIGAGVALGI